MAAILLRVLPGFDALDLDTEPQPPHRELAQPVERVGTCEGNAVIDADGLGQAEFLECVLEHGEGIGFLGGEERLAGEQIAAGEVADRQRVAIAPVGEHELALVVGAPQVSAVPFALLRRLILRLTRPAALGFARHDLGRGHTVPGLRVYVRRFRLCANGNKESKKSYSDDSNAI